MNTQLELRLNFDHVVNKIFTYMEKSLCLIEFATTSQKAEVVQHLIMRMMDCHLDTLAQLNDKELINRCRNMLLEKTTSVVFQEKH